MLYCFYARIYFSDRGLKMGVFYDFALLGIVVIFVISGLRRGIVRSVIELVGFVASLVFSVRLSGWFAALAGPYIVKILPDFPSNPVLGKDFSRSDSVFCVGNFGPFYCLSCRSCFQPSGAAPSERAARRCVWTPERHCDCFLSSAR
jgi:hypothetical protein